MLANGKKQRPQAGQKILATDTRTGKNHAETITAAPVHNDDDLYDLKVCAAGRTVVIDATSNHLFWDQTSRHWAKAAALKYGTHLRTPFGGTPPSWAVMSRGAPRLDVRPHRPRQQRPRLLRGHLDR